MLRKKTDGKEPEPKMVALNAKIPEELYRKLGRAKYDAGKSIQEMVAEALRKYLESIQTSDQSKPPRK